MTLIAKGFNWNHGCKEFKVCGDFGKIIYGDNLKVLNAMPNEVVDMIYIDPPFNTGRVQKRGKDNTGETLSYKDAFNDWRKFIKPRLEEAYRVLKPNGSMFFHIDYREAPVARVILDKLFGISNLMNELIWAYDYGGRSKKFWPRKHDNIYWYVKSVDDYTYNYDAIRRTPYTSTRSYQVHGEARFRKGKVPTDVWFQTVVQTGGFDKEKTGYPTQKPIKILDEIVRVHSKPNDFILDFFGGSGTTGEAAFRNNRYFIMVDNNKQAIKVMLNRFKGRNMKKLIGD